MTQMIPWMLAAMLTLGAPLARNRGDETQPRPSGMRPGNPQASKEEAPKEEKKEKKKKRKEDVYLALRGGDVYTVTDGVVRGATVLVKNGKIQEVGRAMQVPEKAEILDVSGMRVYPGLVAVSSSGIVGRPPVEDSTDPFGLNMLLALASGITTTVTGNSAVKLTYGSLEGMTLRDDLFVRLTYSTRNPSGKRTLRADLDRVRKYLRDKRQYDLDKKAGKKDLKEPDGKWIKGKFDGYRKLLSGEATAYLRASRAGEMRGICALAGEYGIRAVIEGGVEAWTMAPELGRAGVSLVITPRSPGRVDRRSNRPTGATIENARILYEHGVPFAIRPPSTGISSLGGITGRDLLALPLEADFAVRGGLPQAAALGAITIGAARILGIDDRVGSIEPGKDADLIVCDGDLLHYETMVQWAVVNGKIVYDKEKEPLFRHIRPRAGEGPGAAPVPSDYWPRRWIEGLIQGKKGAGNETSQGGR